MACTGRREIYVEFASKTLKKETPERPRYRWEVYIKIDL